MKVMSIEFKEKNHLDELSENESIFGGAGYGLPGSAVGGNGEI